ncbi:MAG: DUF2237 domain-containing protein [Pseudomonadota bacterium]|nr:DUF2237 domain-containing protein [Pseudomonadota bacterium]|tara:strand:+ start:1393 stop:1767 length:375 start_codon:yes stop_codon:yes gene_type:complete
MNEEQKNVLGLPLEKCNQSPMTGYFRDGSCNTDNTDVGSHTVCAKMTSSFLEFSKNMGNDLSTPQPELGFKGLKEGDTWCLCANRWLEAYQHDRAPYVILKSTNQKSLEVIDLDYLKKFAIDIS